MSPSFPDRHRLCAARRSHRRLHRSRLMPACRPLIILGPGRSYTTLLTAMLGQHPQMYGFPETHLLTTRTISEWSARFGRNFLAHGLYRLIAELMWSAQTEEAIRWSQRWLLQRLARSSVSIFCELAERVWPRVPIDKSPVMVKNPAFLKLARDRFPDARFLHVTRHPVGYGLSIVKLLYGNLGALSKKRPLAVKILMRSPTAPFRDMLDMSTGVPVIDPQRRWYQENLRIVSFLSEIPRANHMRVRGEDLVQSPEQVLETVTDWLQLRSDRTAIECMKHPERWSFARLGPRNAPFGGDPNFYRRPTLHPGNRKRESLNVVLPWSTDMVGFHPEVRRLAELFGYD